MNSFLGMAPSLESPRQADLHTLLKATPKLVAPEPGMVSLIIHI